MQHVPFAPWMRGADALELVRGAEGPKRSVAPLTYYAAVLRLHERLSGEVWSAEAWVELARTKLMAGDVSAAEAVLQQAALIGTPDPDAACLMAEILLCTGRSERAHELLDDLTRGRPGLLRAHLLLGHVRRDLGRVDEDEAWRGAIAIDPDCAEAWYRLASHLSLRKEWLEAVAAYREALRVVPDHAAAIFGLGLALKRAEDGPGSLECVTRLREIGALEHAELLDACLQPAKPLPEGVRLRPYPRPARRGGKDA